jgi:tRNA pseudouridine55 synthase
MFGLLNLDKPACVTSRDVVNRVQRLVRPHKVGHCGTLDPLATGALVIAIGAATRLVEYVQRMPKTYRGTFLLGKSSDTEDIEGQVIELPAPPIPTREQLQAAIPTFLGTIQQTPPVYSAVKIAGERSYDLARRGQSTEIAPRPVEVHALEIVRYAYPELELLIRCGSGTYVRSLGRDLARAVGTAAVMSALRREAIGPFDIGDSQPAGDLTLPILEVRLLSPILALGEMPRVVVSAEDQQRLACGQSIPGPMPATNEIAAVTADGRLIEHESTSQRAANRFSSAPPRCPT